ncbi:MAG: RND transporter [Alteromonas sp.]|nr:RND transporter [Alteromonas sp.]|tara:strand:- start:9248 stop:10585 length:1338 start_codon:yes stop_codon:yes gene_type:complete
MRKSIVLLAALAWLSGCAVGPDYQPVEPDAPERFLEAPQASAGSADEQRFWAGFEDPMLAGLIQQTLDANRDLRAALARYQRAEALLRGSRAEQLPSVGVSASAAEQHLADVERTPPGAGDDRVELYQAAAGLSWELDLFGQLATSYFELRGLQQQLLVARSNVDNQRQSLEIVRSRVNAGRGTAFDEVRAIAQLEATRAVIPDLQAAVRGRMFRIAVLTGQNPAALVDELAPPAPLPESLPVIPVGSPGEVLRRRPDIRAAERRLAAASARIGVATADLFPSFSLDALIGSVASDSGDLFSAGAESRRVALGVDWTFLDFGRVRSRIDAADADSRAALANYEQTVLLALEETETQLVRYARSRERSERLGAATDAAGDAAELARTRYRQGFIGFFEVLAAEQELIDTRDALIESRTAETLAMVNIYRALAGAPGAATPIASAND